MSKTETDNKYKKLLIGLLFDAIGMLSFTVPFIGELSDVVWAPLSAWLMTRMYKGRVGQGAGIVTFLEEIIPGVDVVPTFTIMWLYAYVFKKASHKNAIKAS